MQFISMRPAIVLISSKHETFIIRKNETIETLLENELVPDYLRI
jgi:hypothetical protein